MSHLLMQCSELYVRQLNDDAGSPAAGSHFSEIFPQLLPEDVNKACAFIMALGGITVPLVEFVLDRSQLPRDRQLASSAVSYLLMPVDLLPESDHGLVGHLDDALYVFQIIQRLACPSDSLSAWEAQWNSTGTSLLNALPDWLTVSLAKLIDAAVESAEIISVETNAGRLEV